MRLACPVLVSILLCAASPALADNTSLPLVAKLFAGLADGGKMVQGSLGTGDVKAVGDGGFEVTFPKGTVSFLYDEPDTCVFTQHLQMDGQVSDAKIDFTRITGIDVRDQGEWEGLHAALVTFAGPPEILLVVMDDKLVPQEPAFAFLASSVTVDELSVAATEMQRIC